MVNHIRIYRIFPYILSKNTSKGGFLWLKEIKTNHPKMILHQEIIGFTSEPIDTGKYVSYFSFDDDAAEDINLTNSNNT